jgi:hypothetical protein
MIMEDILVSIGIFFVVMGLLTRRYPKMINQWRYASDEERRNIDIKDLQEMCFRVMSVSGVVLMGVGGVNYFVRGSWSLYVLLLVLFVMSVYMLYAQKRCNHNPMSPKKKLWRVMLFVLTVLLVIGVFFAGKHENGMELDEGVLRISGMYGEDIALKEIDSLYMSSMVDLPSVEMRTNGYADGEVLKGYFRLSGWGSCKLLVHDVDGDVIVILANDKRYIINCYEQSGTEELYALLRGACGE